MRKGVPTLGRARKVNPNPGGKRKHGAARAAPPVRPAAQPENTGRNPDGTFAKGDSANPAGKPKGAIRRAFRPDRRALVYQSPASHRRRPPRRHGLGRDDLIAELLAFNEAWVSAVLRAPSNACTRGMINPTK